ncbi:fimbria/pilus periplasmic chaperone [Massilia sp. CCM 8733]|uniref:Fimbria/pilus periplasmic chaperone n=1 Tax=Massilia mucilaginosa TaxID=2609282 RepID=A0ABX0NL67_9BURK|nr:fimbria/pilus periplasmic chaperone [Massilia mucilaginosa]NHZ87554.1 fimbria/pilus periplasmic chaperone [Massilia mucilaginosa]
MHSTFALPRAARLLAAALMAVLPLQAMAGLMLNPTRVVFTKNQRAAQVELINSDSAPATYRISLVNRRMSESGEFTSADKVAPEERFADAMLSFSPRQVTLLPGSAQVVRVMLRKPDALAAGEYRSHLHFEKLANSTSGTSVEQQGAGAQQIGVVLNSLIGASIPVIVRHQTEGASVTLGALALQKSDKGAQLVFQIARSGDSSVYGDISAAFTPQGGAEQVLAKAAGVAIYTPNPMRKASLAMPAGVNLARGTVHLRFRERAEAGGALLAEATLALP